MYYSIYAQKDTYISSGSNFTTGESEIDKNFGQDEILELSKVFRNESLNHFTRVLVQFDLTQISSLFGSDNQSSITGSGINAISGIRKSGEPQYFLNLYEAQGNTNIDLPNYDLMSCRISQSWGAGPGHSVDNPKKIIGASWKYANYSEGGAIAQEWQNDSDGNGTLDEACIFNGYGGGGNIITASGFGNNGGTSQHGASQSFTDYGTPDVNMNITQHAQHWFGLNSKGEQPNYGLVLAWSGSHETDSVHHGHLKFFSSKTNTIYSPKLTVAWDSHQACSGSNTGSLTGSNMNGTKEHYIYPIGLKEYYKESEKVKFRFGIRDRYIQKTISTSSVNEVSSSYIPEGSASYQIVDVTAGEVIVPFDAINSASAVSCDTSGMYFEQWLNTFITDRTYRYMIKVKYDDNQEKIFDESFDFKIVR